MQEESHIWRGCPSQWENLGAYAIATFFAWLVFPLFWAGWRSLVTRCTKYLVTSERISLEQGVFSKRVEELELYRVKDTTLRPALLAPSRGPQQRRGPLDGPVAPAAGDPRRPRRARAAREHPRRRREDPASKARTDARGVGAFAAPAQGRIV